MILYFLLENCLVYGGVIGVNVKGSNDRKGIFPNSYDIVLKEEFILRIVWVFKQCSFEFIITELFGDPSNFSC